MEMGTPGALIGNFQGNAQAFQQSTRSTPYLIAAALVVIYAFYVRSLYRREHVEG